MHSISGHRVNRRAPNHINQLCEHRLWCSECSQASKGAVHGRPNLHTVRGRRGRHSRVPRSGFQELEAILHASNTLVTIYVAQTRQKVRNLGDAMGGKVGAVKRMSHEGQNMGRRIQPIVKTEQEPGCFPLAALAGEGGRVTEGIQRIDAMGGESCARVGYREGDARVVEERVPETGAQRRECAAGIHAHQTSRLKHRSQTITHRGDTILELKQARAEHGVSLLEKGVKERASHGVTCRR